MAGVIINPKDCFSIPGALGELYICADDDPEGKEVGIVEWLRIRGIDNFTESYPIGDTDQSSEGWQRSIVNQCGYSVTATGRRSTTDPGQAAVMEVVFSWAVGCNRMRLFRFRVFGSHTEDPDATDEVFWSTPRANDSTAGPTDDFTFGVVLPAYQKPQSVIGEPLTVVEPERLTKASVAAQRASAGAPATASGSRSAGASASASRAA
jgi:hypothetical protein